MAWTSALGVDTGGTCVGGGGLCVGGGVWLGGTDCGDC